MHTGVTEVDRKSVIGLQQLFPVAAGSLVFNVGDEIQQIEVSRLIAGNIDLEEVLDQRATRARRAGPLPTRYRLQPAELLRTHRNLGVQMNSLPESSMHNLRLHLKKRKHLKY